jgi:ABC-type branched-subunit amino acid transport system ATPase component
VAIAPIIEVAAINTFYGKSHVLHDVTFRVRENEVVALLGRNGAGKTSALKSIMGLTVAENLSLGACAAATLSFAFHAHLQLMAQSG